MDRGAGSLNSPLLLQMLSTGSRETGGWVGWGVGATRLLHEPITHTHLQSHPLLSYPQPGRLHGLGWVCLSPRGKGGPVRAFRLPSFP